MARGDSIIRVSIIGDARQLVSAIGQANTATGGLLGSTAKTVGGTLLALGAVREGFAFLQTATQEADRLGDATSRLNIQLGDLASPLLRTASGFRDLGASTQDMLELEATFADMATGAGLTDEAIASLAERVAATATAASLLSDQDAATIVTALGRASQDSIKPLMALGVSMSDAEVTARALADTGKTSADALTEGELAAARLTIALEQLAPKLTDATTGTADLELQQRRLDAAAEELQAKLGGPLSDALATVLGFINDEIDAIPGAIQGWQMLGKAIEDFGRMALGPLGNVADALRGLLGLIGQVGDALGANGTPPANLGSWEEDINRARRNFNNRNGLERSMGGP